MQTELSQASPATHLSPLVLPGGYDPTWFEILSGAEEEHFWFRVRNQIISTVAARLVNELGPTPRLLEVGCGNGNVLRALKDLWPRASVIGLDLFDEGLRHTRQRCQCETKQGDIRRVKFPDASFDFIGIFDVLEHLPDDEDVLRILHSLLAPGGVLLLTVPACPSLWSYFDEAAGHCRRYQSGELDEKLRRNGFQAAYLTHFMTTIFPLLWFKRRKRQRAHGESASALAAAEMKLPRSANIALRSILQWERWWISHSRRLPIGTSLLALAQKN